MATVTGPTAPGTGISAPAGVRGAIGPYLAVVMLDGLHIGWLPGFTGIGPYTFLVTAALAAVAQLGFMRLNRSIRRQSQ